MEASVGYIYLERLLDTMSELAINPQILTKSAFAPYGDVIEIDGATHWTINDGFAERFHDLATIDVAAEDGHPLINIFRAKPYQLPLPIRLMERHPLGSQAFFPLGNANFIVIVAPPDDLPQPKSLVAFVTGRGQGVSYARGVWHHPLIVIGETCEFLVIDRGGPGENCDEVALSEGEAVLIAP